MKTLQLATTIYYKQNSFQMGDTKCKDQLTSSEQKRKIIAITSSETQTMKVSSEISTNIFMNGLFDKFRSTIMRDHSLSSSHPKNNDKRFQVQVDKSKPSRNAFWPIPICPHSLYNEKKSFFFSFCRGSQGFENVAKMEINFHKEKHWFKLQTVNMIFIFFLFRYI